MRRLGKRFCAQTNAVYAAAKKKTTLNLLETWCKKWKLDAEREPRMGELDKIGSIREIVSQEISIIRPIF